MAPLFVPTAGGRPMCVSITNAGRPWGWVADEKGYRYTKWHPVTGRAWPVIPASWMNIADRIAGPDDWDCAHIVRYDDDGSLGLHRDETEFDIEGQIVTISLGRSAKWKVRESKSTPITSAELKSGDVTLLSGPSRHVLHGVEGLRSPEMFDVPLLTFDGRYAISIRSGAGRPARLQAWRR